MDKKAPPKSASSPAVKNTYTAFGLAAEASALPSGLYVVATPIGNLQDITFRALSTLAAANTILAEDTRVTKNLLSFYGITTPLVAYHDHSNDAVRERLILRLQEGQVLALVSDAGTPLVSDPGFKLVESAIAAGVTVTPVPGPSAILTALVASGLPTDRFFFEGFLPPKQAARLTRLAELSRIPGTLVFYEAPHRLPDMLQDASQIFKNRQAVVARELTKFYETVRRGTLGDLAATFQQEGPPKGEIVVLIGAGLPDDAPDLDRALKSALENHSVKDAAELAAQATGLPKREAYARALEMIKARDAS
jgi:16S rRNA (cytidine1402-2'-O)-methyltransferase